MDLSQDARWGICKVFADSYIPVFSPPPCQLFFFTSLTSSSFSLYFNFTYACVCVCEAGWRVSFPVPLNQKRTGIISTPNSFSRSMAPARKLLCTRWCLIFFLSLSLIPEETILCYLYSYYTQLSTHIHSQTHTHTWTDTHTSTNDHNCSFIPASSLFKFSCS